MNRRGLWVLGLLGAVVLVAYVSGSRAQGGPPLDPDSTAPDGARAVVELIDRLGGDMAVVDGPPDRSVDVALMLEDRFSREEADDLMRWVRAGGVLVVADVRSVLTPPTAGDGVEEVSGACSVPALADVSTLAADGGRGFRVPTDATGCFSTGSGSFVVDEPVGDGHVVSVGDPDTFTNAFLDEADNAVLAGALLGGDGQRAAFLRRGLPGAGEDTLVDLVGTPVRAAIIQLGIVFLFVVLWRARRLGRPVDETQPVQIQGSELTSAVGRLLRSNRRPDRAAAILRDHARRELSGRLGLSLDAPVDVVESSVAAHTTLDDHEVRRAVSSTVTTDHDLVEVAHLLDRIREELTHDRPTARR